MKRYNCTSSDKRGAFGLCMEEHKEGAFVPFSEVSGLAEQLADATRQCGVMAGLLREVTKIVPAIGVAIDDLPVVDAFLERIEKALTGQALGHSSNDALAMMMGELHDICVGLDAPGGAQNGAEAWDQVKGARDRVLSSLNQGRPDTEWTDAATSPVAADYRELQEQHDQLQSKHKAAMELLRETRPSVNYQMGMQRSDTGHREEFAGLLSRIDAMLSGQVPSPAVPEGLHLIYIGEIEVSHKWWINSKSDFFHPSENADFSDWPDGVNKLFRIAASPRQQGGEPCATEPPSSSPV